MHHRIAISIVIMLSVATYALGQDKPSEKLSDTLSTVRPGDFVRVIDAKGEVTQGTIIRVTSEFVQVKTAKRQREWKELELKEIRKRKNDSLSNGALIGLGVGLAGGLALGSSMCTHPDQECEAIATAIFLPIGAGAGLAAGLIADSSIHRFDTVFRAPRTSTLLFNWSPIVSKHRKGVAVAFRF